MKKLLLSGVVATTFIGYSITQRLDAKTEALISPLSSPLTTPLTMPMVNNLRSHYKDGEYTGRVTDAFYGNIQVKTVVSGGQITDIQFLDYPSDRRTSIEINRQAMPLLKQETIQAQSANVDGVSGATQTSRAYIQSLKSALIQAQS